MNGTFTHRNGSDSVSSQSRGGGTGFKFIENKKKKKITRRIPTIGILFFKNSMAVVVTQKTVFDGKTLDGDDWRPVKIFLSSVARLNVIDLFSNIQQINYAIQVQIHVQRCR